MHLLEGIPTTSKPNVPMPGYQGGTVSEDFGLHKSPTVLGGEVQPANAMLTMPFGKVHARIEEGDGAICGLLQQCHPGGYCTLGEVPGRTNLGNYSQEDPASPHQGAHQRAGPAEVPTEEVAPTEVTAKEEDPTEVTTKEVAPTEVTAKEADPTEVTTKEVVPTEEPPEEPTALTATISKPAEEPDIPPCTV